MSLKKYDKFWVGLTVSIVIFVAGLGLDEFVFVEKQIQEKIVACEDIVFEIYWQIRKEPNYDFISDNETWKKYGDLGCDELLEFDNINLILMSAELKQMGVIP